MASEVMSKYRTTDSSGKVPRLSDTSLRYMAALYDPRGVFEECWIPTQCRLTQKSKCFARGQFSTGTTGVGYVTVNAPGIAANDVPFVTETVAASVGTMATALSAFTGIVTTARSNAPFATATIAGTGVSSVQGRVVGAALYVKYAGTELNRGGDMILVEAPDHRDLQGKTPTDLLGYDGVKRVPVLGDKWQHVCFVPINANETDFNPAFLAFGVSSASRNIGIIVSSAGAPQPFDYEVYAWVEYSGQPARAPSLSFEDPIGYAAVSSADDMFNQLDSELGLEGFIKAVHAQLLNQSVPSTIEPRGNFVGLLSFLPALANALLPSVKAAGGAALSSLARDALGSATRVAAKPPKVKKPPPPPPPPPKQKGKKKKK